MKKWKLLFFVYVFLNYIKCNIFGDIKIYLSIIFKLWIMFWGGGGVFKKIFRDYWSFWFLLKRIWYNFLNFFSIIVCYYNFFFFWRLVIICMYIFFDSYYDKRLYRWKMNEINMYINMFFIYISYIFKIWKKLFVKLLCNRK